MAYTDINICPGPNNCGGDHNHPALQAFTTDILVETIALCLNAQIVFFGDKPNQYAVDTFLEQLINGRRIWKRVAIVLLQVLVTYCTHSSFWCNRTQLITQKICSNLLCACVIHSIFGVDIISGICYYGWTGYQISSSFF